MVCVSVPVLVSHLSIYPDRVSLYVMHVLCVCMYVCASECIYARYCMLCAQKRFYVQGALWLCMYVNFHLKSMGKTDRGCYCATPQHNTKSLHQCHKGPCRPIASS